MRDLQALEEGEEEQQDGGGGENGKEGGNGVEGKQECRRELEGEATRGKVVAEKKKNRWFAKYIFACAHFHICITFPIFAIFGSRWLATVRRHSMAISGITAFQSSRQQRRASSEVNRRTSIQGGLTSLSKQMTQGLGLGPAGGQNVVIVKGCTVTKAALQESLSKCLRQPHLRVARLESHPEGDGRRNHVEVVVKWPEGRRKMTLEMRRVCEGDHQAEILLGPVTKICHYLEEALESPLSLQYIPLPRFFNIDAPHLEEEEEEHTGEKSKLEKESEAVVGIEVPGPSGFLSLSQGNLADYEHSALTITAIARLPAGSYFAYYAY